MMFTILYYYYCNYERYFTLCVSYEKPYRNNILNMHTDVLKTCASLTRCDK
jgi:hypothetical protein